MPLTGQLVMPGCVMASAHASPREAQPASPRPPGTGSTREVLDRFVDLMYRRGQVRAAFESCVVREGFIDHAGFASRAAAMSTLATDLRPAAGHVEVLHVVCEGDIAMVHLALQAPGANTTTARVEIFRLAEGRIVEHWSVAG